jgi:L-ascorbate metabolism protein UlaG (beta-lactamase superfamily)
MDIQIDWYGHDSFRLAGEKVVYVDPWKIAQEDTADVILVTHDHYDHFSKDDIAKLSGPATVVVAPPSVAKQLKGNVLTARAGEKLKAAGLDVEVIAAYNIGKQFHPKNAGGVGYVVTLAGTRVYHTGDSDLTPEMEPVRCDIALLPVSGTYVMTAREAVEAANKIKPALAIPMHWGDIIGSRRDAEEFQKRAKVPVKILEKK